MVQPANAPRAKTIRRWISIAAAVGVLAVASQALANGYTPRSSAGFASLDAVHDAVGTPTFEVSCPREQVESPSETGERAPHLSRGAKVTLQKPGDGYRDTAVEDTLLSGGLQAALQQCPMQWTNIIGQRYEQDEVGFVDIYGQLAEGAPVIRLVHGDRFLGVMGQFGRVVDEGAQEEQREADARAEQERQASAQQQATAQAARAQVQAEEAAQPQPEPPPGSPGDVLKNGFRYQFLLLRDLFFIAIGFVLFFNRLSILRFFYSLTPHPAADAVYRAINSKEPFDANRLIEVLNVSASNSVEREVRLNQAAEILRKMRERTKKDEARLKEEFEDLKSRADMADAAEVHARIKRMLDAILRAKKGVS